MTQGVLTSDKRINRNKTLPAFVAFFFFLRSMQVGGLEPNKLFAVSLNENWNLEIFGTARILSLSLLNLNDSHQI